MQAPDAQDAPPPMLAQDTQDAPPPPPPLPPAPVAAALSAFESLPGPLHLEIAACLPDGDQAGNRLRVSLVSQTLKGFYGGTLTVLTVQRVPKHPQTRDPDYPQKALASTAPTQPHEGQCG